MNFVQNFTLRFKRGDNTGRVLHLARKDSLLLMGISISFHLHKALPLNRGQALSGQKGQ